MILGVTVLLRFAALGTAPPGVYQDEAINGLDARAVLAGDLPPPLYFSANNGREPLYIYLAMLSIKVLGATAFALRLPAALLGVLTIPAAYALGRAWFDRRVGLFSAGVLAVMLWHVHLSHLAFRAVALPLCLALALAAGAHGLKTGKRWALIVGGTAYGLSFYTYMAVRFTPLALALIGLCAFLYHRDALRARRHHLAIMGVTAALVVAPLGLLTLQDPGLVLGRTGQVAIWETAINGGDLPGTLAKHMLGALGMFGLRGDTIARHNPPGRPVFDPLMALAWLVGLGLMLRAARRNLAAAAVVIWIGTLLLPTVLAEDAPHFLRAVAVLPVAVLPIGYALTRVPRKAAVFVLALSAGITTYDYFGRYIPDPNTALAFDKAAAVLASEVNMSAQALIDWRIWERYPAIEYLTAGHPALHIYYDDRPTPRPTPGAPMLLVAWPYEPQARLTQFLPSPAEFSVTVGPEARYAPEAAPFNLYVAYAYVGPPTPSAPLATFEDGMALLRVDGECAEGGAARELALYWQADVQASAAYTAMIHTDDGQVYDAPPGTWAYPTDRWRTGDVVVQRVRVAVPCDYGYTALALGLYMYNGVDAVRLPVVDANAPAAIEEDGYSIRLVLRGR